jgi:hypothetical protein
MLETLSLLAGKTKKKKKSHMKWGKKKFKAPVGKPLVGSSKPGWFLQPRLLVWLRGWAGRMCVGVRV